MREVLPANCIILYIDGTVGNERINDKAESRVENTGRKREKEREREYTNN